MMTTAPLPVPVSAPPVDEGAVPGTGDAGLRGKVLLATAVLLLLAWAAVAGVLVLKRQDAIAAELRQNTNVARAFEEQTLRVLATVDQATRRARDAMAAPAGEAPDPVRIANETGLTPGILVQLSLVDARGRFIGSNLDPDGSRTGHVDLATREHIRVHLAPETVPPAQRLAQPDALFISKPVLGKVSNKWTIQLSRRVVGPDGQMRGVIVASLDPSYFEDVYRRVSLGPQGTLGLIGADLVFRARVLGAQSVGMGTTLSADAPLARHLNREEGQLEARSTIDQVERLVAYRRVADYPLFLLVSTARESALAGWNSLLRLSLVLTAALTLVVSAAAAHFLRSLQRLERTHQALRRSEAQANAANQAKSEFLAAISHELRTPLTSIRGFAELMEHRLDDARFREQAGLIRKGAEHLNELLTQILDLAKVEAGAMPLALDPMDVRALVAGTADFFSLAAVGHGLALHTLVADDVPAQLTCDALRLKQVLNNLLSNAIKFTESGSVTLSVSRRGGEVDFAVIDTGPGIAPELHETIFERFRQADSRVSYQHGGTGLGLALSRGLAQLMQGELRVQSQPGQGAAFTLTLPLR